MVAGTVKHNAMKKSRNTISEFFFSIKERVELKYRLLNYFTRGKISLEIVAQFVQRRFKASMVNKSKWVLHYSGKEWQTAIKNLSRLAKYDSDYKKFKDVMKRKNEIRQHIVVEIITDVYKIESFEAMKHNLLERMQSNVANKASILVRGRN